MNTHLKFPLAVKGEFLMVKEKVMLERALFPEQAGVSSEDIFAFIQDLEQNDIEAHSFMVLRHGKVAFETWREPYSPDIPHTMYSVSKSFASAAAGFAVDEGFFSLETKLLDIFPEYRPEKPDDKLEKITIRHLLTMTAGKDVSLVSDKTKNQWKSDFFRSEWYADPDDGVWRYISETTYMVCAAIVRTTGKKVVEFLTPRLFEPLGFSQIPFWETDGDGIEAGGWGLYITTEDLARFIRCCHTGGVWGGRQVLPKWWAREAVKKQAENLRYSGEDNRAGYGYFFWRNGIVPNSYRADGMFSQFAIAFDDFDAEFVITACEINEQKTRDCIWRHFPAAFIDSSDDRSSYERHKSKLFLKPLSELPAASRSPMEKEIEGKSIFFGKPKLVNAFNFPVSMLPFATVYMSADRAGNIDNVRFSFGSDECTMTWLEGSVENTVVCGMDGRARNSPIKLAGIKFTARCSAAWEDERTLNVWFRPLEGVCRREWKFLFKSKGNVVATPSCTPDSKNLSDWLINSMDDFIKNKAVSQMAQAAAKNMHKVIEPVHKGVLR